MLQNRMLCSFFFLFSFIWNRHRSDNSRKNIWNRYIVRAHSAAYLCSMAINKYIRNFSAEFWLIFIGFIDAAKMYEQKCSGVWSVRERIYTFSQLHFCNVYIQLHLQSFCVKSLQINILFAGNKKIIIGVCFDSVMI